MSTRSQAVVNKMRTDLGGSLALEGLKQDGSGIITAEAGTMSRTSASKDASSLAGDEEGEQDKVNGRKAKARDKQRANRQRKRQLKREEAAAGAEADQGGERQANSKVTGKLRHRPSPRERSMIFFMKMHDWSRLFLNPHSWLSYLKSNGSLDRETVDAISRTVKQCWLGEGSLPFFRSVTDLERFAEAKSSEAAYLEKQLGTIPPVNDNAWEDYRKQLERRLSDARLPSGEAVEGVADFLRDTILPCLKAQVQSLRAKISRSHVLRDKHRELRRRCDRQAELDPLIQGLRLNQALLLPICPPWKQVELEISRAEKEMLDEDSFGTLLEEETKAWLAYQRSLSTRNWPGP